MTADAERKLVPPGGTDRRVPLLAIRSMLRESYFEVLPDAVCPSSRIPTRLYFLQRISQTRRIQKGPRLGASLGNLLAKVSGPVESRADLLRQTFLEDVEVPLALNHIANVLLVKREEMTRHVECGVKRHGYAAIQTDRRIKDAVEIAEGDAALRLIVDEEA
ncbi:Uncharacterized protein DBV15_01589 [Temnothorax longispinosus]|uniref:Uncharacterized protein n=1 Tax=Temnothorax longispinosus TaxID=300112 RepID=A0A4V3SBK6_9HYME|nr:Uncharacterized protein DBV15_01589 [Temnothorax longispinosus]